MPPVNQSEYDFNVAYELDELKVIMKAVRVDKDKIKQIGSKELWHFMVDFERYLLADEAYETSLLSMITQMIHREEEQKKLFKLLKRKMMILLHFIRNMFQFSFNTVI